MNEPNASVLSAEAAEFVLPAPPRMAGEVVVLPVATNSLARLRHGGEVARRLGEHFVVQGESQRQLAAELRERLLGIDELIAEATRAQLKGAVRDALRVLDWLDATHDDALRIGALAANGAEPVDVADLVSEIAVRARAAQRAIEFDGGSSGPWWGEAAALHEVVELACELVIERTGGRATTHLGVEWSAAGPVVLVTSRGEAIDDVTPTTVQRFRSAVERAGALVQPAAMGPGAPGMRIQFASAAG